jgi:hypothetical protein
MINNDSILKKSLSISQELFPSFLTSHDHNRYYLFAFGFRRGKLIAIGRNDMLPFDIKTKKLAERFNSEHRIYSSRHAEVDLINRLWGKVYIDRSLKLVVLRYTKEGKLANAKPCKKCQTILDALNITRIFYSNNEGNFERLVA